MSFNRTTYDPCEYNTRLSDSYNVLAYDLDSNKFYNQHDCRIDFGVVAGNNVSVSNCNLVDVESDLRNQTRLYSNCPQYKFLPQCTGANCGRRTGLPCAGKNCQNQLRHLPTCRLINYQPRITNVGYTLETPTCPRANPASLAFVVPKIR